MNRAIMMVFALPLLVGMIYWGIGMRPSPKAVAGVVVFLAVAFYFVWKSKKSEIKN